MMENQTKTATSELERLDAFVGKWNTSGRLKTGVDQPVVHFHGTDTYKWLPGGFFLLHEVDVMMGEERKQSIEVIGYDPLSETYPMHHFDDKGRSGIMHGKFEGNKWTIVSMEMRFSGEFSDDKKTITGSWEQCVDNKWLHLMEMALKKP